jgi:methionine-S-sulfoxide reductase
MMTLIATFAGGCFWCMQPEFDKLPGVLRTSVGYTGGKNPNPTYEEVCSGTTGHAEAILIEYDPQKLTYKALLQTFWRNIDPTTKDQQFADRGTQYRTVIYYHSPEQKAEAESSKRALETSKKFSQPIVTEIVAAKPFYPAETYHQCYYKKKPLHYQMYKEGSGRAGYLRKTWGH